LIKGIARARPGSLEHRDLVAQLERARAAAAAKGAAPPASGATGRGGNGDGRGNAKVNGLAAYTD
jgi:hypothetical protein